MTYHPIYGVHSGRFLGWWREIDMVWRDEHGVAVGYVEAGLGPWSVDEAGDLFPWKSEPQIYSLYRFAPGVFGQLGVPYGELLNGLPQYGLEWAGRFRNSFSGPGLRAVPDAGHLQVTAVPPRPDDWSGISELPGDLVNPEECTWQG